MREGKAVATREPDGVAVPGASTPGSSAAGAPDGQGGRRPIAVEALLDWVQDGVYALDREWRYTYVNRRAAELVGHPPGELLGRSIWEVFPESVGLPFYDEAQRAMAEQTPARFEAFYPPLDIWYETDLHPSPDGLLVVSRDITARKVAERERGASQEQLQLALEAASLGLWSLDLGSGAFDVSSGASRLHGLSDGTPLDRAGALDAVHPDDRARVGAAVERALAARGEYRAEFRIIRPDGETRWMASRGRVHERAPDGRDPRLVGIVQDVTDRQHTAEALRRSEERLRRFIESNVIGILFGDVHGGIAQANDEFLRIVGYSREDLASGRLRWTALTPPEYLSLDGERIAEALERGSCAPYEKEYIRKDGSRVWVLLGFVLLGDRREEVVAFILDIGARKAAEREREQLLAREQAAVQVRDALLASVSHDLKNPLTSIKGLAQLARRQLARSGEAGHDRLASQLDQIGAIATRMAAMLDELVDVAQLHGGVPLQLAARPTDLVALARDCVGAQQRTTDRHTLTLVAEVDELVGLWDHDRLERVLANLVGNAIKYSPDGGAVTVTVACEEGPAGCEWARLVVRDWGLGIPAEDLPHIFERFRRGRNVAGRIAGTGIGLASAGQIVAQHGGTIDVASREGEGATFTVRLPLA